jgi:hypothetical protein
LDATEALGRVVGHVALQHGRHIEVEIVTDCKDGNLRPGRASNGQVDAMGIHHQRMEAHYEEGY